jgi:hypothetical protein
MSKQERSRNKKNKKNQHDIVFRSHEIPLPKKHCKSYDNCHHQHYMHYREDVLPYYEPITRYHRMSNSWMSRFYYTIQDIGANYPIYPTVQDIESMQHFITSLPNIVPCRTTLCSSYIANFIDRNTENLDAITSNRVILYDFLRDFYFDIKQKFGNELYEDSYYHGI